MKNSHSRHAVPAGSFVFTVLGLPRGGRALFAAFLLACSAGVAEAGEWRAFWVDAWGPGI